MNRRKLWVPEPMKVVLTNEEFDDNILNPNEVIVKSLYSHISAGTEQACIAGIEGWFPLPNTPGYTAVGKVLKKGSNVTHVKEGDLVFTYGKHAEIFKFEYGERWGGVCVKLPDGVNPEHAAFTHMAGIALTALRNSNVQLGDFVLVTGLGAIGNIAAQLAQLQGATVIATDINDHRIGLAKQSGIIHTVNSKTEDLKKRIAEITGGKMVSTYIDASGASAVINQSLEFVATYGEVILLGTPRAPYESNVTKTLQYFHLLPSLTLKGALEFTYPTHQVEFVKHSIERNAEILMNLMKDNKLKIAPFYSHKLHPSECQKAYDGLREKPDEFIGVLFDWTI